MMGETGKKVMESGVYKNSFGKRVTLNEGDTFPTCPKEGKPIAWEKVAQ